MKQITIDIDDFLTPQLQDLCNELDMTDKEVLECIINYNLSIAYEPMREMLIKAKEIAEKN